MPLFGSSSSSGGSAHQAATPAPPSLPRAARPSASGSSTSGGGGAGGGSSESHATFLFAQVRQTLQQLHRRGNVLARDYSELLRVLDKCEFHDEQSGERGAEELMHVPDGQLSKEELGKRNAWMRETVSFPPFGHARRARARSDSCAWYCDRSKAGGIVSPLLCTSA